MITHEEHLQMLKDCASALNTVPRKVLNHPRFNDTYDLAAALSRHIRQYEIEADVQPVALSR